MRGMRNVIKLFRLPWLQRLREVHVAQMVYWRGNLFRICGGVASQIKGFRGQHTSRLVIAMILTDHKVGERLTLFCSGNFHHGAVEKLYQGAETLDGDALVVAMGPRAAKGSNTICLHAFRS